MTPSWSWKISRAMPKKADQSPCLAGRRARNHLRRHGRLDRDSRHLHARDLHAGHRRQVLFSVRHYDFCRRHVFAFGSLTIAPMRRSQFLAVGNANWLTRHMDALMDGLRDRY